MVNLSEILLSGMMLEVNLVFGFNPHMHKLGPRGPTHYIFSD